MCFFSKYRALRQKRSAILFFIEAAVQRVNLLFYLVPNAYILTNTCLQQAPIVFWSGWVRWTCWNTVSLTTAAQYLFGCLSCCQGYGDVLLRIDCLDCLKGS